MSEEGADRSALDLYDHAVALAHRSRWKQAAHEAAGALRKDPSLAAVRAFYIRALAESRWLALPEARQQLWDLIERDPRELEPRVQWAVIAFREGWRDVAIDSLVGLIKRFGNERRLRFMLGYLLALDKRYPEAWTNIQVLDFRSDLPTVAERAVVSLVVSRAASNSEQRRVAAAFGFLDRMVFAVRHRSLYLAGAAVAATVAGAVMVAWPLVVAGTALFFIVTLSAEYVCRQGTCLMSGIFLAAVAWILFYDRQVAGPTTWWVPYLLGAFIALGFELARTRIHGKRLQQGETRAA